jgi:beta-lactamase superfamily II metal-dependent hydrolase
LGIRIGSFSYNNPEQNEQKVILIDGGYKNTAELIEKHLKEYYSTTTIDYAFITHPDADHISGFLELLNRGKVKVKKSVIHDPWNHKIELFSRAEDGRRTINSISSNLDDTLSILSDTLDLLGNKNEEYFGVSSDETLGLYIIGPTEEDYINILQEFPGMDNERYISSEGVYTENEYPYQTTFKHFLDDPKTSAKNDSSMIILVKDSKNNPIALFTGDAGVDSITKALRNAKKEGIEYKNVALMQLPHHGSIKNINKQILDLVNPEKVFVSAPDNDAEHPSKLVVNYILSNDISYKHINSSSGIVFYFDGATKRPGWGPVPEGSIYSKTSKIKNGL